MNWGRRYEGPSDLSSYRDTSQERMATFSGLSVLSYGYFTPAANRERHYKSTPAVSFPVYTLACRLIYVCLILGVNLRSGGGKALLPIHFTSKCYIPS